MNRITRETTQHEPIKGRSLQTNPEGELRYFKHFLPEFLEGETRNKVAIAITTAVDLTEHGYGAEVMEALKAQFSDME